MGILDLFRRKPTRLVRVILLDIAEPPPRMPPRGSTYIWRLKGAPEPGMRVLVPGMDGPTWALVMGVDEATRQDVAGQELGQVSRRATAQEEARGRAEHESARNAWLDMMRRAAGLPAPGDARRRVPDGYPEVPPAEGTAPPEEAGGYGLAWWRAHEAARDDEERERFETLGRRWDTIQKYGQ